MGPPVSDWDQRPPETPPASLAGDREDGSFSNVVRLYSMPALPDGMLPTPSQTPTHDAGNDLENVNRRTERLLSESERPQAMTEVMAVQPRYTKKNINLTRKQRKALIVSSVFPCQRIHTATRCKK